jgi:hypothetical protein
MEEKESKRARHRKENREDIHNHGEKKNTHTEGR